MGAKLRGLVKDLSSDQYHKTEGMYSSSQLKTMLESPEKFYRTYITKEIERKTSDAMDEGTYFHTAILEPEKLDEECAVYTGKMKSGKAWEDFKEKNKNKVILSTTQRNRAHIIIDAVRRSDVAMDIINAGTPEISAFAEVWAYDRKLYHFDKDDCLHVLDMKSGWVNLGVIDRPGIEDLADDIRSLGAMIVVKVRADCLGQSGVILDLKSTSGDALDERQMKSSVSKYQYELSAALYLDIFTIVSGEVYDSFIWTFASKDMANCKSYKASDENIQIGRKKWSKAVIDLAFFQKNGWKFPDTLGVLGPEFWQKEWLEENADDLL